MPHKNTGSEGKRRARATHDNRDPLTDARGAHPVGVGVDATAGAMAGGAAAGAIAGSLAGPVGTAIGGAIGAVAGAIGGGLAGKDVAEHFDPTTEEIHWRTAFRTRPYVPADASYDDYAAAYQYGWESADEYVGVTFDKVEPALRQGWTPERAGGGMPWDQARHAVKDAWERAIAYERQTKDTVREMSKESH